MTAFRSSNWAAGRAAFPNRLLPWLTALLCVAWLSGAAFAHEIRPSIATLDLADDETFDLELSVNLEALMAAIGPEHQDSATSPNARRYESLRALPPEALEDAFGAFSDVLREGVVLEDGRGEGAILRQRRVEIPEIGDTGIQRTSLVTYSGAVPNGATSLVWRFSAAFGPSVIRVKEDGGDEIVYSDYLLNGAASAAIALSAAPARTQASVFLDYVAIGFEHIVPKGLDHILFVVGLFLLSPSLKPLLWQVTCFTLAHSVTLALGMLGILRVSPSVVEPLIALSIVYVAVENLFMSRLSRWRPLVIFGFGLLHGLGFAGVLDEIGLTSADFLVGLVAFNVGVELGQLAVLAGCFLAVGLWFGHKSWYRAAITTPASLMIAAIGAVWFFERLV